MQITNYVVQGSICETRKGPNRPPIRMGIDYLVYALVLEIQSYGQFNALKRRKYDQISDVWLRIEHGRFGVFEVCPREHLKYRREERCSNPFWKKK